MGGLFHHIDQLNEGDDSESSPVDPTIKNRSDCFDNAIKFYWTQAEVAINHGSYQQMSRLMKKALELEKQSDPVLTAIFGINKNEVLPTEEAKLGEDIDIEKARTARKYVIHRKQTHDGKMV